MLLKISVLVAVITVTHGHWTDWAEEEQSVKPPNCDCSQSRSNALDWEFKPFMRKVCGTNGVTYDSKCEFVNNASLDKNLGVRCHGSCPCKEKDDEHFSDMKGHHFRPPICLNNGETVYGIQAARDASKADICKKNDYTVGIRCFGECIECQDELKCPALKGYSHHRWHHHHHCRPVTNETAPNCDSCSEPSAEFLSNPWGQEFLERSQICGSNNVTYRNKCAFLNGQAIDKSLGKRCHGQCPCSFGNYTWSEDWKSRMSSKPEKQKPVCLNNGATVNGWKEAIDAMKNDMSLGIRCKGQCDECQSKVLRCPFDWVKFVQEKENARPHPPNCTCPKMAFGFMHRRSHKVCGNNNQTYNSICDLINAQPGNPDLGFRCLGECPCRMRNESNPSMDDSESEQDRRESRSETGTRGRNDLEEQDRTPEEENIVNSENNLATSSPKRGHEDEQESNQEVSRRRHHHHGWRPHHHRRWRFPICLTNGRTVHRWWQIAQAFRNDSMVGIRCKGHCSWCTNHTQCPRFPPVKEMQKIRLGNMMRMHKFAERWESMTVENPNKPPNCSCSSLELPGNSCQHHRHAMFSVCGNNNVTFADYYEFINNQSSQSTLGSRCFGSCPCSPEEFQVDEDDEVFDRDVLKKSSGFEGRFKFVFCLTNGQSVYKGKDLKAALAADPGLGIRCMNECSACQPKCPRIPKSELGFRGPMSGMQHHEWIRRNDWGMDDKFERIHREDKDEGDLKGHQDGNMEEPWQGKREMRTSPGFEFEKAYDFGYGWKQHGSDGHEFWSERNMTTTNWECDDDM